MVQDSSLPGRMGAADSVRKRRTCKITEKGVISDVYQSGLFRARVRIACSADAHLAALISLLIVVATNMYIRHSANLSVCT